MVERPASGRRALGPRLLLDAWPLLLALVLLLPLLTTAGHPLARDLVFVPRQPWTDAGLGLGDAAPRAVPLDALVSLLTLVVDGGVLAAVVLPLTLATAGWGAHRLLPGLGTAGRLAVGGFAVWNPFVVERLALGQWALLLGYAALPWVARAATRWRRGGERCDLAATTLWVALASLTPTGGLLAVATALALGAARTRRTAVLVGAVLPLQLPWLLPGLLGASGATSDPAAVAAFAARDEGPGGVLLAVLAGGGVWDAGSVPGSRASAWGLVAAVVCLAALVVGGSALRRCWGTGVLLRVGVLAAGGLVLALVSSTAPGADALRWAVAEVPGAGLLRDAQKYAAPWALLLACGVGAAADALLRRVRAVEVAAPLALVALALPVLLLPDATRVTWPTVELVTLPAELDEVAAAVAAAPADVVALPWRSYRRFSWGTGLISSDPAPRLLDAAVLVSGDLTVGDEVVAGESPRAREVGRALETGSPAAVLPGLGVGWVLVWTDDPGAADLDLTGLEPVVTGDDVALYRTPEPVAGVAQVPAATRGAVLAGDLLAVLLVGVAVPLRLSSRKGRIRTAR